LNLHVIIGISSGDIFIVILVNVTTLYLIMYCIIYQAWVTGWGMGGVGEIEHLLEL